MKLSIKFQDDPLNRDQHRQVMTAKVPTTIFNQPFVSGVSATTTNSASDFSFSFSTNFPSGPSLKLSYTPTTTNTNTASLPFSLSLKSGLGISGSPRHSPLVFSARFSFSPSSSVPVPTFFLHLKPQFGHFSPVKTVFSDPITDQISRSASGCREPSAGIGGNGSGDGNSWPGWKELKLETCGGKDEAPNFTHINNPEDLSNGTTIGSASESFWMARNSKRLSFPSGIAVMARTAMPVTKGLSLNLRWSLNFPGNMGLKMPSMTVNKVGLEWVTEAKENKRSTDASGDDLHLLKGTYLSMQRELENVEKENREMEQILDEMKRRASARNHRKEDDNGIGKKVFERSSESSSEFERWRSKKNAKEEKGQKEPTKSQSLASDLESELQKAIKIASS